MRIQKILPVTCVMLALSVPAWAQGKRFDFDYKTTDTLVQVFDDGAVTRIQYPEGTPIPTVIAVEPKGEVLLKPRLESPHLVLDGIFSKLLLRWGNRREVQAIYVGAKPATGIESRAGTAASFGSAQPQATYGAVAKPVAAQAQIVNATAPAVQLVPRVQPVVETETSSIVKAIDQAAGFVPQAPTVIPAKVESKTWQIDVKDVTLATTFNRWADAAGQKVRWDADRHVLVEAPDSLIGTFESAVTRVLSSAGIAQSAYPLEVCFYPNNPPLARITRKGEQKDCN